MAQKFNYDKLAFTLAGKHFEGKQVAVGLGMGASVAAIYGLRKYFGGGWCYIEKDLTGKNVVVTGGNNGIGKETARKLVQLGARVIIGARDQHRNDQTVKELSKIGKGRVVAFKLDLADKKSIQQFAKNVQNQLLRQPLHYLLNNAGLFALPSHKLTKQNLQMQIGVNHFGHFYLTYLLWDKLAQSQNPRIVNVSSGANTSMTRADNIDFGNLHYQNGGYNPFTAYSRSKKANILFTKELQRRMFEQKINGTVVSLHPGVIMTNIKYQYLCTWWKKAIFGLFVPFIWLTGKNLTQGAQTSLYCLLEDDQKLVKGGHYADCKISNKVDPQAKSPEVATRLWQESEKYLGQNSYDKQKLIIYDIQANKTSKIASALINLPNQNLSKNPTLSLISNNLNFYLPASLSNINRKSKIKIGFILQVESFRCQQINKTIVDKEKKNQQPIMCHPCFLASAQMQGQQCFLSAIRSLVHLISAMMSTPPVSKALAQALTVFSISTAHSTSSSLVHS